MSQFSARDIAVTALGPAIWGTSYYATTNWLPEGHPVLDSAVRALPAGLALLAVRWQAPRGVWIWRLIVLGMLNIGLFFPLLFIAAQRIPGGIAGAIGATQPLLVLLISAGLLRARITLPALLTSLAGVLGVSLLVLRATGHIDPVGVAASATGTALMGVAIVLAKRWGPPPMSPITVTGWMLTAGGVVLAPAAVLVEGLPRHLSTTNYLGLVYLAVFSGALSYYLWMRGITILPGSAVSFLSLTVPLVAATIGWLALDQSLNAVQLLGMAIALGSLVVGQRVARPAAPTPKPLPTITPALTPAPDTSVTTDEAPVRMASCTPAGPQRPVHRATSSSRLAAASRTD